jgi:hypothetical protein
VGEGGGGLQGCDGCAVWLCQLMLQGGGVCNQDLRVDVRGAYVG